MTTFRSTWLALLGLLRCLEVNLLPLGIDSIQATFWTSMNLGDLVDSNRLLSPLFKRWLLRLIRLFEKQPFHQRTKSVEHNQRAEVTALIKRCCQEFSALTKTKRAAVPRVNREESALITSDRITAGHPRWAPAQPQTSHRSPSPCRRWCSLLIRYCLDSTERIASDTVSQLSFPGLTHSTSHRKK